MIKIIFCLIGIISTSFYSSAEDEIDKQKLESTEIRGVIVDRTVTRLGADFYSFFSRNIYEQYPTLDENILIKERPTALSGSIITVFHFSTPIYRTALSPGRRQAQEKSDEAIQALQRYLLRWKLEQKYRDKSDLADNELQ
ncbi:CsgE family curli-type amyloid fiber assembly protein [Vibrio rumoiensis]|uniref:CsgE family curli-type amyloid fiber assembly protein n=1 Tax=Vibrio rumoiensis TaxID=76258 RepID=UPI00038008F8|nr:CsgE family curli-type amyloid fiber assembly protein [Vibrio rumoiensis]